MRLHTGLFLPLGVGTPRKGKKLGRYWFSLMQRCGRRHEDCQLLLVQQVNSGSTPSLPAIIQNLPDALLGDAKDLSQRRYRLAVLVS
jgi:hypothetical protein